MVSYSNYDRTIVLTPVEVEHIGILLALDLEEAQKEFKTFFDAPAHDVILKGRIRSDVLAYWMNKQRLIRSMHLKITGFEIESLG